MEQTRMIIAVVLSVIILILWNLFFVHNKPVNQAVEEKSNLKTVEKTEKKVETPPTQAEIAQKNTEPDDSEKNVAPEIITVNTALYQVRISEQGAAFKSFQLKAYRETLEKDSPPKELIDPENTTGTVLNGFVGDSVPGISKAVYTAEIDSDEITVTDQTVTIPFLWRSRDGVIIEKEYTFFPDSYKIGLNVKVDNRSRAAIQDQMTLSMRNTLPGKSSRYGFTGPSAMVNNQVQEIKPKKLEEKNQFSGNISWAAFQDLYFMSSIIPTQEEESTVEFLIKDQNFVESKIVLPKANIQPASVAVFKFQVYFGPKSITILKTMGHRLEKVVDFGWFDPIARPCLWVMNWLYHYIPNYGVAIILLTIFIKILLWPLGNKSYKSMSQMKKMQPLMADIRERYKDDKQKMNIELMSLYKTYKVNPLGGCLPMIAQMPVFFAFYRMLYQAVELRHAPFMGWINDLSAPDRLFNFGVHIPFMHPPYGIPVLTIIMGATQLIQQKMQPPAGDPAQAKMMMLMPIFFTVIFVNFPSGLVLYWLVNNILNILQQYYVNKKTA